MQLGILVVHIYTQNPDLSHGHCHLNFSCSEHIDHINRKMWKGDITSCNFHLPTAWTSGCAIAMNSLAVSTLDPKNYAFDSLFSKSDINLLSAFGGGCYPGINVDDDEDPGSILPAPMTVGSPKGPSEIQNEENSQKLLPGHIDEREDITEDVCSLEDELEDQVMEDCVLSVKGRDSSLPSASGLDV